MDHQRLTDIIMRRVPPQVAPDDLPAQVQAAWDICRAAAASPKPTSWPDVVLMVMWGTNSAELKRHLAAALKEERAHWGQTPPSWVADTLSTTTSDIDDDGDAQDLMDEWRVSLGAAMRDPSAVLAGVIAQAMGSAAAHPQVEWACTQVRANRYYSATEYQKVVEHLCGRSDMPPEQLSHVLGSEQLLAPKNVSEWLSCLSAHSSRSDLGALSVLLPGALSKWDGKVVHDAIGPLVAPGGIPDPIRLSAVLDILCAKPAGYHHQSSFIRACVHGVGVTHPSHIECVKLCAEKMSQITMEQHDAWLRIGVRDVCAWNNLHALDVYLKFSGDPERTQRAAFFCAIFPNVAPELAHHALSMLTQDYLVLVVKELFQQNANKSVDNVVAFIQSDAHRAEVATLVWSHMTQNQPHTTALLQQQIITDAVHAPQSAPRQRKL